MIKCPVLGRPVSTGLSTDTIILKSLSDFPIPLRCPAFKKLHRWKPKDAWLDQDGRFEQNSEKFARAKSSSSPPESAGMASSRKSKTRNNRLAEV
jgi:hypothetical protein